MDTPLPSALEAGVTMDVDFLGKKEEAFELARNLQERYAVKVEVFVPDIDDATPQSAKVVIYGYGDRPANQYVEIDYLHDIIGFNFEEAKRMKARAPLVVGDKIEFQVMHPLDVIRSRVANLATLPSKRNEIGAAQTRLAVDVVRDWFRRDAGVGNMAYERSGASGQISALRAAEELIELAHDRDGVSVFREFDIDVLQAIPVDEFATQQFREVRWPQAVGYVGDKRG